MTNHTPTPCQNDMHGTPCDMFCPACLDDCWEINRPFIVRAVNEYQSDKEEIARLKKVIKESKQYREGYTDGESETIAKAEGSQSK